MNTQIAVSYHSEKSKDAALVFALRHGYPCIPGSEISSALVMSYSDTLIELIDREKNIRVHIDFTTGNLAHRQQYGGGRGQTIAKAIGLKQGVRPPSVIDATAGLAKDAFVMACLGCPVTLLERSPIITELIQDAINRAAGDDLFKSILETGFEVINTNSIDYLTQLTNKADIIYLDPMYPQRKKSASVKKNMQILQKLLDDSDDSPDLINIALQRALKRVVVKRPKMAESLSGIKPTYFVASKKTRFDIYITPQD